MNRYKVARAPQGWPKSLPFRIGPPGEKDYGVGEEFEHKFTPEQERDNLASGLLEIVPQKYRVVGDSDVFDTPPGKEFTAALLIEQEAMLIAGGHIERVAAPQEPKKKEKK